MIVHYPNHNPMRHPDSVELITWARRAFGKELSCVEVPERGYDFIWADVRLTGHQNHDCWKSLTNAGELWLMINAAPSAYVPDTCTCEVPSMNDLLDLTNLTYRPARYGLQPDGAFIALLNPAHLGTEAHRSGFLGLLQGDPTYALYAECREMRDRFSDHFECFNPISNYNEKPPATAEMIWWFTDSTVYFIPRTEGARLWLSLNAPSLP